ncbi:MAG: hypothetical protein Q7R66_08260 [Undibacterium sp.]|uniref:hypothetical protein n=1 Tax=Undibacterium sp. TaxID=1914977 RepID=UPI0027288028|nr:hypothetical protein [Undibacterium sp.]MDO8652166.1 hypothetical protein [Undibacterium sp.]
MVDDPAQYRWSSYRHHALGQSDTRWHPHPQYLALGTEPEVRQAVHRDLFRTVFEQMAIDDLRLVLQQAQALGSEQFKEAMSAASGARRTPTRPGRPAKLTTETIKKPDKKIGQDFLPPASTSFAKFNYLKGSGIYTDLYWHLRSLKVHC